MYQINKASNSILPLEKKSFSELGFRERQNLQEWIVKQPNIFGEDLLIIQKEFSGFDDTNERLDLLALDKQGSLVIIENKLDDSGRDVTWQAIKYASYCSSLSKDKIIKIYQDYIDNKDFSGNKAEEAISDFMDGQDFEEIELNKGFTQRIILLAVKFRKEVTSSVLWLMNFKIRLQCFTVTPFALNDALFLNVEQIIPTKDAEDYMIGMADKVQDDIVIQKELKNRHDIRREFWTQLIPIMNNTVSNLFANKNPSNKSWIYVGTGIKGLGFAFVATRTYGRVELYIDKGDREKNEAIFDELLTYKESIENDFSGELEWCKLANKRACCIKIDFTGNIFDRNEWQHMIENMTDAMCRLEIAFEKPLQKIRIFIREQ